MTPRRDPCRCGPGTGDCPACVAYAVAAGTPVRRRARPARMVPPRATTRRQLNRTVVAVALRTWRTREGLSQRQAAQRLGLPRATVSLLERRHLSTVKATTATVLTRQLGVPLRQVWQ